MSFQKISAPDSLRRMMDVGQLIVTMSAHNPIGAKLAAEAGFKAIWASGFELSASLGFPDASIISMSDHLDMCRRMAVAVDIPVIADIDTGFGNAVNVHYAVEQYKRAGVGAVVIEDKHFPKDTSLRPGGRQELVSIEEFTGKIEAALDASGSNGPLVVARTEALIAELGIAEAQKRAEAYAVAGAPMVLVHSKETTGEEIRSFLTGWKSKAPVAIVPTAYPSYSEKEAIQSGKVALYIYGNHGLRSSVSALRMTYRTIRSDGGAHNVECEIATVGDILNLQGEERMSDIEKKFLK